MYKFTRLVDTSYERRLSGMKTICIKTNNTATLSYLLNELRLSNLKQTCFTQKQFKHYKNITIHYSGQNEDSFIHSIADILSYLLIDELEESFLANIIHQNYFYFDTNERNKILSYCFDLFSEDFSNYFDKKFSYLHSQFYSYLKENKSIILQGFINFRIQEYFKILDEVVSEAVNSFIIEKEYLEFISLLKLYINSQNPKSNIVHLIYKKNNPILLDENKNIIPLNDSISDVKYLSDISFSKNDLVLNILLSILPKKIYLHLINNNIDEFANTLILIFDKKIEICTDCNLCNIYNIKTKKIKDKSRNKNV